MTPPGQHTSAYAASDYIWLNPDTGLSQSLDLLVVPFSYRTIDGGDFGFGYGAATVPDGRTIVAGARHWGISRYDLLSGEAYPPTAGEQASTIWDVTTATLPGARAVAAGAGYDGLLLPMGRRDRRAGRAMETRYRREGRRQPAGHAAGRVRRAGYLDGSRRIRRVTCGAADAQPVRP